MKLIVRHLVSFCIGLAGLPAAAALRSPSVASDLTEIWANVDAWSKDQRTRAAARAEAGHARALPAHLRERNALAHYAEAELRRELGERYAGVPIAVTPAWP